MYKNSQGSDDLYVGGYAKTHHGGNDLQAFVSRHEEFYGCDLMPLHLNYF
jgi:hypothetical protein